MTRKQGLPGQKHKLADRGNDLNETPPEATWTLLEHEGNRLPQVIWEPACGPGAIVRILRSTGRTVYATDLVDYRARGSRDQDEAGWDFLFERQLPLGVQAIVMNPPYKLAVLFLAKALELAPIVYALLRVGFIEGGSDGDGSKHLSRVRNEILDRSGLEKMIVFRNRLPMMHRAGWNGPKLTQGMIPYAWYKWDRDYQGRAYIERVTWKPLTAEQTLISMTALEREIANAHEIGSTARGDARRRGRKVDDRNTEGGGQKVRRPRSRRKAPEAQEEAPGQVQE